MTRSAVAIWGLVASIGIILAIFAGMAYVPLLGALLLFMAGLWVASEVRWRSLLELVWGQQRSAKWADRPWKPWYALFLLVHGLVWLGLAVVLFLLANIRVVSLF
jgi:hypothetical protein